MVCTQQVSSASIRTSRNRSPRTKCLRATKSHRKESRIEASTPTDASFRYHDIAGSVEFGYHIPVDKSQGPTYNVRGRQGSFKETASQRQERLSFPRSRVRARSRNHQAQKCLRDPSSSGSAVKSSISPRIPPVEAAIKIQRAYRAHRALFALSVLEQRIAAVSDPALDTYAVLPYLRSRAAELGVLGALLDSAPHMTEDPRVHRKARRVTETLCRALDRAEFVMKAQQSKVVWVHRPCSGLVGGASGITLNTIEEEDSSDSDYDDIIHDHWHGGKEHADKCESSGHTATTGGDGWQWSDSSSSESDSSDDSETEYEFGSGVPEPEKPDDKESEARRAAFDSLCSGSIQQQLWISQILRAPPLSQPKSRVVVSKVPALLTIAEDSVLEL